MNFLDIAKQALAAGGKRPVDVDDENDKYDKTPQQLEAVLKGRAVELWSDSAGRLFLVADEEDATLTMARYGAGRGEIYSATEMRRILSIHDSATIAEIQAWKHKLNGTVSECLAIHQEGRDTWAEWKANELNRLFQEQGVTGEPGRITAATVRHGEQSDRVESPVNWEEKSNEESYVPGRNANRNKRNS